MSVMESRMVRLAWSAAAAAIFVVGAFAYAWGFNHDVVWPLLPGARLGELVARTPLQNTGFQIMLFFLGSILFWAFVFYGATFLVEAVRKGKGWGKGWGQR